MLNAIVVGIRFVILVLSGHRHVALENAALRQQLAVFKRDIKRPRLHRRDRLFWIGLRTIWKNWKSALVIVRPETVISWQRKRFKRYWWRLSQAKGPGRPPMSTEIRKLVRTMAAANVLWGAPRIHGELLKLGFEISERTISRLMPKRCKEPSQTWKTFLNNHVGQLVSIDFFTVPTLQLVTSRATYMERHSAIGACVSSNKALELAFLRIQEEERDHAAAVDRVFERIKSSSVSGPRRMILDLLLGYAVE